MKLEMRKSEKMQNDNLLQLNRCSVCGSTQVYHNDLNVWICIWVINGNHLSNEEIDYFRKYGMRAWNTQYGQAVPHKTGY